MSSPQMMTMLGFLRRCLFFLRVHGQRGGQAERHREHEDSPY